jgi:hypothetical protein
VEGWGRKERGAGTLSNVSGDEMAARAVAVIHAEYGDDRFACAQQWVDKGVVLDHEFRS